MDPREGRGAGKRQTLQVEITEGLGSAWITTQGSLWLGELGARWGGGL